MSRTKVNHFLDNPHTMMGVKFLCTHRSQENEDVEGEWNLVSHSICIGDDDAVEDEYQIQLKSASDGPVAMGREEVRYLLAFSRILH